MPSGSYEHELGFGNMGPARVKKLGQLFFVRISLTMVRQHKHRQHGWALLALFILLTACVAVDGGIENYFIQPGSSAIDAGVSRCRYPAL